MTQPAIDTDKFNAYSAQVTDLHNRYLALSKLSQDDERRIQQLIDEIRPFTKTEAKALAFSQLGALYFLLKDKANMQFSYETAKKNAPANTDVIYHYALDLFHSGEYQKSRSEMGLLLKYSHSFENLLTFYRFFEYALQLSLSEKAFKMIKSNVEKSTIVTPELMQWLAGKEELFQAYQRYDIDVGLVDKLLTEINQKLRPNYPANIAVHHYYLEQADMIVYSFVDQESDLDTVLKRDEELGLFTVDFEEKHNVHFHHLLIDYGFEK